MDRLGPGLDRHLEDLVNPQIAFGRSRRAQQIGLIGQVDVPGPRIGFRINGNGAQPHAAGGFDDPASDFTAIGNP